MGFIFRRSIGIGPFRINFSKSGVGVSVGARGIRTGISSTGRRSTRLSIPGTGIGYQVEHGAGDLPRHADAPRAEAPRRPLLSLLMLAGLVGLVAWILA